MVPYGYKSKLYYYSFGNGGGNITMQDYTKSILPIVEKRMKEIESSGETFIFQEDNDRGHGTRSSENIAIHKKIEMNLDFIEQWPANRSRSQSHRERLAHSQIASQTVETYNQGGSEGGD
jgi:hypothetical protein